MPQFPHPDRRRRRPGRNPPGRLSGRFSDAGPGGFTGHGFGSFYRVLMPTLRGSRKRAFFNRVSGGVVLGFALGGAALGSAWFGPAGALLGLALGVAAGCSYAETGRFYRR